MALNDRIGTVDRRSSQGASLSGTNLERAGDHNQRVTLQAIRVNGPITRADLAEITGLTAPAIANITRRLLNENLILEAGRRHGGRGQPAMKLVINADGGFSLGINIDRDHVTLVILDFRGQVRAYATQEMDFAMPEQVTAFFRKESERLIKELGLSLDQLLGVGVALPDDLGGVDLPHRPEGYGIWNTVDVAKLFSSVLPLPVFVENDAAAAAMGELQFGHGLRNTNFFYILVTSGLGGGLVIEGDYFRGSSGRSGEIGFLPVHSSRTTARTVQEVVSLSALKERLSGLPSLDLTSEAAVRDASPAHWAVIDAWIDLSAELLTPPMLSVSYLINPDAVYIGGRLPTDLVDRLSAELMRRLAEVKGAPSTVLVERAALAADAPAIGAATLPFNDRLLPSRQTLMKTFAA